MAEVHVTSWAEFLQAVQVAGDDVHCPDGAVWDMNELEPDGHVGSISFSCATVYGHNTTIRNLRYDGKITFASGFTLMSDLHWENILANLGSNSRFFERQGTISAASDLSQMTLCKFSGFFTKTDTSANTAINPIYGFKLYRCGANVESPCGAFTLPYTMEYTNFLAQLPNVVYLYNIGGTRPSSDQLHYFCNIVTVAPNCTADYTTGNAMGSVFRGRKERLTAFAKPCGGTYMNLYCSTDMDAITNSQGVVGVTEAQLRDSSYLQNIGFPIGV